MYKIMSILWAFRSIVNSSFVILKFCEHYQHFCFLGVNDMNEGGGQYNCVS